MVYLLRKKRGQIKSPSFLPIEFSIGSTLQVNYGECEYKPKKKALQTTFFVAGVPEQVSCYCQIYPTKVSEAWREFHDKTFQFFGGAFPKSPMMMAQSW